MVLAIALEKWRARLGMGQGLCPIDAGEQALLHNERGIEHVDCFRVE